MRAFMADNTVVSDADIMILHGSAALLYAVTWAMLDTWRWHALPFVVVHGANVVVLAFGEVARIARE